MDICKVEIKREDFMIGGILLEQSVVLPPTEEKLKNARAIMDEMIKEAREKRGEMS